MDIANGIFFARPFSNACVHEDIDLLKAYIKNGKKCMSNCEYEIDGSCTRDLRDPLPKFNKGDRQ